jgi:hypothetical protein
MINLNDIKVSADEFREYTGIDLKSRLKEATESSGNPSDAVNAFIYRTQTRLNAYIDTHFFFQFGSQYSAPTDNQKKNYKLAVMEQLLYVFKNGDISVDAGRDDEGAMRSSRNEIEELAIAPNAKLFLHTAGIWRREIQGIGFSFKWWELMI